MSDVLCPLCGKVAASTIEAWGGRMIGCPCVPPDKAIAVDTFSYKRGVRITFESIAVPPSRTDPLAFVATIDHDPGDEDRA